MSERPRPERESGRESGPEGNPDNGPEGGPEGGQDAHGAKPGGRHLIERAVQRMQGSLGAAVPGLMLPAPAGPDRVDEGFADPPAAAASSSQAATETPGRTHPAERLAAERPILERPPLERAPLERPTEERLREWTPPAGPPAETVIGLDLLERAGLAVVGTRRSRVAEEWRVTSSHLLRSQRALRGGPGAPPPNLLMVTSAQPDEGKSFCAVNLAASLALGGLSEAILVDLDTKPGGLSERLGLSDRLGLFDLVNAPATRPEDLLLSTAITGLMLLPIGRPGAAPGERSVTRPVAAAVERVARRFPARVVILDVPPVLATSDPSTLAPLVGQIALVIEAERTQRREVETALDLVHTCQTINLVLNKTRMATTHAFGEYSDYDA